MKSLFIALFSLSIGSTIFSQSMEFNHSAGATYIMGSFSGGNVSYGRSYIGITYNPRYDYVLSDEMSVGVSAYPTGCFSFSSNTNSNSGTTSSLSYAFESPILAQFNYGNHSNQNSDMDLGGFVGAGFNFGIYSELGADGPIDQFGDVNVGAGKYASLCLQAGIKYQAYGLRVQLNKPLGVSDEFKVKLFAIGVLYNF